MKVKEKRRPLAWTTVRGEQVVSLRVGRFSPSQPRGESDVLLLVGERLREPVAMGGPIVMNYDWEIDEAYRELQAGTILKRRKS